jgi:hypothetical protein
VEPSRERSIAIVSCLFEQMSRIIAMRPKLPNALGLSSQTHSSSSLAQASPLRVVARSIKKAYFRAFRQGNLPTSNDLEFGCN